jgi:hypothetical protein
MSKYSTAVRSRKVDTETTTACSSATLCFLARGGDAPSPRGPRRQLLQIFFAQLARFQEINEERLCGAIEDAIYEFADHAANNFGFSMRGTIDEGTILTAFFQKALGFKDFHHCHDGGVSDFALLQQGFINIADGGVSALPHELHDFKFPRSERGELWSHGYQLYSTIYFVLQGQAKMCPAYFAFVTGQKLGR